MRRCNSAGHKSQLFRAGAIFALLVLSACRGAAQPDAPAIGPTALAATSNSPFSARTTAPGTSLSGGLVPAPPETQAWVLLYQRESPPTGPAVDIRAVGDVMLGRGVAEAAEAHGPDHPFAQVGQLLAGQITLGNLESPLSDRAGPLRPGPYRFPAPTRFAYALARAGFDALSLANNHALDLGPAGLVDSVSALQAAGLRAVGVGADDVAAGRAVFLEVVDAVHDGSGIAGTGDESGIAETVDGSEIAGAGSESELAEQGEGSEIVETQAQRVALLAFNDIHDPEDESAEGDGWGRAWLNNTALDAIRQARGAADLVIVMPHWGREYVGQPSDRQRAWAQKLVDAGADVVLGAHPHVLQPIEVLTTGESSGTPRADGRTGVVAYSLGNFIFDQGFSEETSRGVVLRLIVDRAGVLRAEAAPIQLVNGQARPLGLESADARRVIERMRVGGTTRGGNTESGAEAVERSRSNQSI